MANIIWGCILAVALTSIQAAKAGGGDSKVTLTTGGGQASGVQWNFRVGAAHRHLGDIHVEKGSYSGPGILPTLQPRLSDGRAGSLEELGIGATDAVGERTYQDGFVFMDGATADPNSFLPGTTANWGYQSDSQVRNGSLYYAAGEYATSSSQGSESYKSSDWSSGMNGASPILSLEGLVPVGDHLKVGGSLSFLYLSSSGSSSGNTFRAFRSLSEASFSVMDRYDLQGVIPPLAPYEGELNPPGIAPLIDNIPTERVITETGSVVQNADFFNEITESIKVRLFTFSLGPTFQYEAQQFVFSGGFGLGLNIADWNASFDERLNQNSEGTTTELRKWRARRDKTEVLPGFYLEGSVGYQLTEEWMLSAFGRYDWSRSLKADVGPSSFSADLGGYTVGGSVTFSF